MAYGPQNLVAINNAFTVTAKRAFAVYCISANTGVTAVFEGSVDGTNWFTIQAQRTDTGEWVQAIAASEVGAYYVPQSGWKATRLRQTNAVAGPLTVTADLAMFGGPVNGNRAMYQAAPPTLSDRQTMSALIDAVGNLKVSLGTNIAGENRTANVIAAGINATPTGDYSPTIVQNFAHYAGVFKAAPGVALSFGWLAKTNATSILIQFHDKATAPVNGETPVFVAGATIGTVAEWFDQTKIGPMGIKFTNGIAFAFSTTDGTLTLPVTAGLEAPANYLAMAVVR